MRIAVTGANGFVGRVLCAALVNRGFDLRVAVRDHAASGMIATSCVTVGDIDQDTDWKAALAHVDVVFHLAARVHIMRETAASSRQEFEKVNVHGTANLARQAVQAGVKRLVYVSSIGVNGAATTIAHPYTEMDTPHPHNAYAWSKWKAEQALLEIAGQSSLEVVIVRPPLVYGPGAPGNFAQMLKAVAKGVPLPLASIDNLRSLIYVENLADALIACALHPVAAGKTYLLSDGEDVSTPDLLRKLAEALGISARLFSCPPGLLKWAGTMVGKRRQIDQLLGSLRVDGSKIRRELGWIPPYTMQQGLQATAERYQAMHP